MTPPYPIPLPAQAASGGTVDEAKSIVFCTTSPNPRIRARDYDCGQKGWRLHAVYGLPLDSFQSLGRSSALCGVRPRHGWSLDLFIEDPCLRCVEKAIKLGCKIDKDILHRYEVNRISKDDINDWRRDYPIPAAAQAALEKFLRPYGDTAATELAVEAVRVALEAIGWRDVKENPAPRRGSFIAYNSMQNWYGVTWYVPHYKRFEYTGGNVLWNFTHWMPLPEPPKETE